MKKGYFYFGYALFLLLIVELVLRICFPLPELSNFNRATYQVRAEETNTDAYLRNIEVIWESSLDTNHAFIHDLNQYGFRDEEWKIKKEKKRFLFIGDSFVEGMMSTQDQTIPTGFRSQALKQGYDFECMNGGMMGIGLNEYSKFIQDVVPLFRPEEVMVVLFANDTPFQSEYVVGESMHPMRHSFWKPRLLTLIEQIQKEDPIPFDFVPEQKRFIRPVPHPANPFTNSSAQIRPHVSADVAQAMAEGKYNYFRTNWILEEEKYLKATNSVKSKLAYLKQFLEGYEARLSIFYIPSRSQMTNYYYQFERKSCMIDCPEFLDLTGSEYLIQRDQLRSDCQDLGLPFLDFSPMVLAEEQQNNHMYWNYDDHMKGTSYLRIGREMFSFWQVNQEK